jgi:hypothetical protein
MISATGKGTAKIRGSQQGPHSQIAVIMLRREVMRGEALLNLFKRRRFKGYKADTRDPAWAKIGRIIWYTELLLGRDLQLFPQDETTQHTTMK